MNNTQLTTSPQIKTRTSAGREMAWFTLRVFWHPWAERRLSNPQVIRGDHRIDQQTSENIPEQLSDLINYLEEYLGMIEKAIIYDNRRPYPFCEVFKFKGDRIYINKLPEFMQGYLRHLVTAIEKNKP
jgi:hypothetical protein